MLVLLSPAKNLNFDPLRSALPSTKPKFQKQTRELVAALQAMSKAKLKTLMNLSDKLADLNHLRFRAFSSKPTIDNAKQAALAFAGDVYQGLDAASLSAGDLAWAQDHLRILSGLYGVLRPLDLIQPYRLEMGRALKTGNAGDLYGFWGSALTQEINKAAEASGSGGVINLASNEYFAALQPEGLKGPLVTPQFKEIRDGRAKFLSFFAKKARGLMARYIIENRITDAQVLKDFNVDGYRFDDSLSGADTWVFSRKSAKAA